MAVPTRPPTGGSNNDDSPKKPERPVLPELTEEELMETEVHSFRGASMDDIEEAEEAEMQKRLAQLSKIQSRTTNKTLFHSDLTSNDLIINNWARYEHLMPRVVKVKKWLVEQLAEQNRTGEIAEARSERGSKYDEMYSLLESLLTRYFLRERIVNGVDSKILMAMVINELLGLGPIEPLWKDERISEIMVNGPFKVRVEIAGRLIDVPGARFRDAEHLLDVCQQILAPINRTVDVSHPLADGSLVDGSRVNIVHTVVANKGPYVTIRRFPDTAFSLKELINFGSMNEEMATDLGNYINLGMSTVVIGGTGSGKTSMLNALSGCIPSGDRVLVIEDTSELRLHPERDILYLQAIPAVNAQNPESGVSIRRLVKNSLRMRPDRIVVGEVRDFAAYDMLQAMNTGHEGSMTTVHANDAYSGVERLVNLLSEGGSEAVESARVLSLISSGVDIFVTIQRYEDGSRRCSGIYEIPNRVFVEAGKAPELEPIALWEFEQTGVDELDNIVGDWVKRNELSTSMQKKHRIDRRPRFNLEEIYSMSEQASDLEGPTLKELYDSENPDDSDS
jgi:pilus assembly protein CpaF